MITRSTQVSDATLEVLEAVVLHLQQAAREVWTFADRGRMSLDLHYLGVGLSLAEGNASAFLPDDHKPVPVAPPTDVNIEDLVRHSEQLLRGLSPEALPGLSGLVAEVCDLVREVRDHGA